MALTFRPACASARTADSRPLPGPRTRTSTSRTPSFMAFCAQRSAAFCAANGVLLRLPLYPALPALSQARTSPLCGSVMVTIVLLKVALMLTTARLITRRILRVAAMGLRALRELLHGLLAGHRLARALARASVALRVLPAHGQPLAVPQPAVAVDVLQALDVLRDLPAQRALDEIGLVEQGDDLLHVLLGEVLGPQRRLEVELLADRARGRRAHPVDVGERDLDALIVGDVDAGDAWHGFPSAALPLLVARIAAHDADHAEAADH